MSMLQQSASSIDLSFIENFLDCNDSLPDEIQRNVTQLRELDLLYRTKLKQTGRLLDLFNNETDSTSQRKYLMKIQRCLVRSQEYGDEKLQLVSQIVEQIENKNNLISTIAESLDLVRADEPITQLKYDTSSNDVDNTRNYEKPKRARRQRNTEKVEKREATPTKVIEKPEPPPEAPQPTPTKTPAEPKKTVKKKAKTTKKKKKESTPEDLPIDPDEPTYCLCHQVSFGDMIGCDNDDCPIEWFHFGCVNLTSKPKGKWYCPNCASERKEKGKK